MRKVADKLNIISNVFAMDLQQTNQQLNRNENLKAYNNHLDITGKWCLG